MKGFTPEPRLVVRVLVCITFGAFIGGYWLQDSNDPHAETSDKSIVSPRDSSLDPYSYVGAVSCNGSACHGSNAPKTKFNIQQNEY